MVERSRKDIPVVCAFYDPLPGLFYRKARIAYTRCIKGQNNDT